MTGKGRPRVLLWAAARGAVAGLVGVAAMTAGEKVEQRVTGRADSYTPARALLTLLGRHPRDDDRPLVWNHLMHWGTGAALGALRGVWAVVDLRGPRAHLAHLGVRLATDQTVENATGVGAPPRTWADHEELLDVVHKGIYALVTGLVAESLVRPELASRRGRASH